MIRTEVLTSLKAARLAHAHWVIFGRKLSNGANPDTIQAPVKCTECDFGKWFYAEQEFITHIPGFSYIEKIHDDFHQLYTTLYTDAQQYYSNPKCRIRCKTKKSKQKESLASSYLELKAKSIELIEQLLEIEKNINTMTDSSFIRSKKIMALS